MGLFQWFKENIQSNLPSEAKARAWMLILLIIIVCLSILIITLHKYSHTFWQDKPVAWTTILPTRTGLIQNNVIPSYTAKIPQLPETMCIKIVKCMTWDISPSGDPRKEETKDKTIQTLQTLWEADQHTVCELLEIPDTRIALVYDDQRVVGTLVFYPTLFHTPLEENLDLFVAHHLFIAHAYRHQNIAIHLMEKTLDVIRKEKQYEPVVLFQVEYRSDLYSKNRLPFAEVARIMRVKCTLKPLTFPDSDTTLAHSIVKIFSELPRKASENSNAHIQTKLTLEPASDNGLRRSYWLYCIQQPNHVVLSIGGEEWIHFIHKKRKDEDEIILKGCSYDEKDLQNMVSHVLHYMKANIQPKNKVVCLIIPQSLVSTFNTHLNFSNNIGGEQQWEYHDGHYVYMYNYKLNCVNVNVPYTMNLTL
jgi:hypothetical protein